MKNSVHDQFLEDKKISEGGREREREREKERERERKGERERD